MQAWLEAYHHTTNIGYTIDSGQLDSRAGAIQVSPQHLNKNTKNLIDQLIFLLFFFFFLHRLL
jgi:hypothetical protein